MRRDDEGAHLDDLRHGSQVVQRAVDGDLLRLDRRRGLEDNEGRGAGALRKTLVEEIERFLRVGARQFEGLAEVATHRTGHRIDADEHKDPRERSTYQRRR